MNKVIQPQVNNRQLRQIGREAARQLQLLRELPGAPAYLAPFIDALERVFVANDPGPLLQGDDGPRPVIGIYCILVPEELIYAAGAIPLRLCGGCSSSCAAGEEHVPRDGCPLAKSSLGLTAQPGLAVYDLCDVVIVPTTCDAKRKFAEELSRFREVWMLEVPHLKDSEISQHAWLQQVEALKARLEAYMREKSGKVCTITAPGLEWAIARQAQAQVQMRRLQLLRSRDVTSIWGRQALLVAGAYSFMEVGAWTAALTRLNDELEEGHAIHKETSPRMLIAGSPVIFPNFKLPNLIEELGAVVVADESCVGDRTLYDPVGHPERNLHAQLISLAARYLMPCICPSFAPNEDRLVTLRRMIATHRVDGVVYHVLKGCVVYDFEVGRVERALKECNVPVVRIETDYSPEDVEQLRTRIEAFVEMLMQRKKKTKE
nr:2-hydroxyacyl-CoA dehydratase family protein [uncultured Desulfobulbus sp.]